MQQLPIKQRVAKVVPFLQRAKLVADPPPCDTAPYVTQHPRSGRRPRESGRRHPRLRRLLRRRRPACSTTKRRSTSGCASRPVRASCWQSFASELATVEPFTRRAARTDDARVRRRRKASRSATSCTPSASPSPESRRLRPVRHAGHSRPRAVSGPHRPGP